MDGLTFMQTYRMLWMDLRALEEAFAQAETTGAPSPLRGTLTEEKRRGNELMFARMQLLEGYQQRMEETRTTLKELTPRFQALINPCPPRLQLILWLYYHEGQSDETIAAQLCLGRRQITRLRNSFFHPRKQEGGLTKEARQPHKPFALEHPNRAGKGETSL